MARILLATSREAARKQFETSLVSEGHSFIHCSDGQAVESALAEELPELVIADVDLPGLDAFAMVDLLQRTAVDIPIPPLIIRPNPGDGVSDGASWGESTEEDLRSLVRARLAAVGARRALGRILVVDDDASLRTSLQLRLAREGHEVLLAIDGEDGLEQMSKQPDLVLTDVDMPRMDGMALLQRIRAVPEYDEVAVIVMTARATDATEATHGLDLGANDYVRKPFDWRELHARVQAQLRGQALARMAVEKQRDLAVIELAGAAAHEINNPLAVLMARIEMLAYREGLDPVVLGELKELDHVVERVAEVVRKLGQVRSYQVRNYCAGVNILDLDATGSEE